MLSERKNKSMDSLRMLFRDGILRVGHLKDALSLGFDRDNPVVCYYLDQLAWESVHDECTTEDTFYWGYDEVPHDVLTAHMSRVCVEGRELKQREDTNQYERLVGPCDRKGCHYHEHIASEI